MRRNLVKLIIDHNLNYILIKLLSLLQKRLVTVKTTFVHHLICNLFSDWLNPCRGLLFVPRLKLRHELI